MGVGADTLLAIVVKASPFPRQAPFARIGRQRHRTGRSEVSVKHERTEQGRCQMCLGIAG